jgi:parallel beta-helix repeat protein
VAVTNDGCEGTKIQNNLIGTDKTGQAALGNGTNGVSITLSSYRDIWVGGTVTAARNVISGNKGHGVSIIGADRTDPEIPDTPNRIQGNYIGLDGTGMAAVRNEKNGIFISAPQTVVGGETEGAGNIISANGEAGVRIQGATAQRTLLEGNYIGTDRLGGGVGLGNGSGTGPTDEKGGVLIWNASENFIGKALEAGTGGNLISGNHGDGVAIVATGEWFQAIHNQIAANKIGTKVDGLIKLGNTGNGVAIFACGLNTVGGASPSARNVISGNGENGVALVSGAVSNIVSGNYIGLKANGNEALGNGSDGVFIDQSSDNTIGGLSAGERNVISGNGTSAADPARNGVRINGTAATGNNIQGNTISGNKRAGVSIELASGNTVGGSTAASGNLIWGNDDDGVDLRGTSGNSVMRNTITLNLGWAVNISNFDEYHSEQNFTLFNQLRSNVKGGGRIKDGQSNSFEGNEILSNGGSGIEIDGTSSAENIVHGNYIGTDATFAAGLGNGGDGVLLADGAHDNYIGGAETGDGNYVVSNTLHGVHITSSTLNFVYGNWIGTDETGNDLGNGADGVLVDLGSSGNEVGGQSAGEGNSIAWNAWNGVEIAASHENSVTDNRIFLNDMNGVRITGTDAYVNFVQGNWIGTDTEGAELANGGDGVLVDDLAHDNVIGEWQGSGSGNMIRYNLRHGVEIDTGTANVLAFNTIEDQVLHGVTIADSYFGSAYGDNNQIENNTIRLNWGNGVLLNNAAWNTLLENTISDNDGDGVRLDGGSNDNQIGSGILGHNNVIATNGGAGIVIAQGVRNVILGNEIYDNGGLGIDLGADGVTANDVGDEDLGANELQNYPIITNSYIDGSGTLHVQAYLSSQASSPYFIQVYFSDTADPSGYGEGEEYWGGFMAWTDENGYVALEAIVLPIGRNGYFTLTATDAWGNTSEFSNAFYVEIPPPP